MHNPGLGPHVKKMMQNFEYSMLTKTKQNTKKDNAKALVLYI